MWGPPHSLVHRRARRCRSAMWIHRPSLALCAPQVSPSMDHLALRGPEGKAVDLVTAAESGMHGRRISQAEPLLPR